MGLLDRFRQRKDDAGDPGSSTPTEAEPAAGPVAVAGLVAAAEPSSRAEQLEELEESAREMVSPAFDPRERIEESLVEQFVLDEDYDLSEDDVREVLQRVWQERLEEQATWSDEGDYRRLAAAFEALESSGILARMNFACCQTCGHAEIGDEKADGSRGYVFFHEQDAQRLAPGGSELFLAFGGFDPALGLSEELVGAEVAGALRREGLTVEWDGTASQRIQVTGLDWRKRLPVG